METTNATTPAERMPFDELVRTLADRKLVNPCLDLFESGMLHFSSGPRRMVGRMELTPHQQTVVDSLKDGTVTLAGRTLTEQDLHFIFSGQQLPKDPEVCRLLGLVDYKALAAEVESSLPEAAQHPGELATQAHQD